MAQCVTCGASLKPGTTRCVKCGTAQEVVAPLPPAQQPQYAAPTQPYPQQPQPQVVYVQQPQPQVVYVQQPHVPPAPQYKKDKWVAGWLALLLGGLGVHKFYLGKPIQGILYLLFCWTWIPLIIGFLEGLSYFSMSKEVFGKRYG